MPRVGQKYTLVPLALLNLLHVFNQGEMPLDIFHWYDSDKDLWHLLE